MSVEVVARKQLRTIADLLRWAIAELEKPLGLAEARSSAERLLEEVSGFERAGLYLEADRSIPVPQIKQFKNWVLKRKARIPVAYLTEKAYFWNEELFVSRDCLIPRAETEILVEKFIEKSSFDKKARFSLLDLACGSGAIGISLLREFPNAHAVFADISAKALKITLRNLKKYQLTKRSKLICSNVFSKIKQRSKFDAIVCNPPYLGDSDFSNLQKEVENEPHVALSGGRDGLDLYREVIKSAPDYLKDGAPLFFEMGRGQSKKIAAMFKKSEAFTNIFIFKDYAKIDRVILARKKL